MSNRLNQEREEKLQPIRIANCKKKLESLGFVISHDDTKLAFDYKGSPVIFFPYSGWHAGENYSRWQGFWKSPSPINKGR